MKVRSAVLLGLVVVIGVGLAFFATQSRWRNYTFNGSRIDPPLEAYDFALSDAQDETFRLSERRGKVVLLFFGYANCSDVCPATLADFERIKQTLGVQAEQVEFVFITIDPARDTPEQVEEFVSGFDPAFIGLSGTEEELQPVWDGYFVYREQTETNSDADYHMDHNARVYVIDEEGNMGLTFPLGLDLTAESMAQDIAYLLND